MSARLREVLAYVVAVLLALVAGLGVRALLVNAAPSWLATTLAALFCGLITAAVFEALAARMGLVEDDWDLEEAAADDDFPECGCPECRIGIAEDLLDRWPGVDQ